MRERVVRDTDLIYLLKINQVDFLYFIIIQIQVQQIFHVFDADTTFNFIP